MTLEEALSKITDLETVIAENKNTIAGLEENAGKVLSEDDLKKLEQKSYNTGFDKAKNQFESDKKDMIGKDDVEKMLNDRDLVYKTKTELLKMGVKNPDKALKMIDESDLQGFGGEDFKADEFKSKYEDSIVFKSEGGTPPVVMTKNNNTPKEKMTAETYAGLSADERKAVSREERQALM